MSTTENLLLGFGALVIGVTFSYFYFRSDWEFWKEYLRSTRKYYWAGVLIGALLAVIIYLYMELYSIG